MDAWGVRVSSCVMGEGGALHELPPKVKGCCGLDSQCPLLHAPLPMQGLDEPPEPPCLSFPRRDSSPFVPSQAAAPAAPSTCTCHEGEGYGVPWARSQDTCSATALLGSQGRAPLLLPASVSPSLFPYLEITAVSREAPACYRNTWNKGGPTIGCPPSPQHGVVGEGREEVTPPFSRV